MMSANLESSRFYVNNDKRNFILLLFKYYKTHWQTTEIKDTESFKNLASFIGVMQSISFFSCNSNSFLQNKN